MLDHDDLGIFTDVEYDVNKTLTTDGVLIEDALGWMDEAGTLMQIFCGVDETLQSKALRMLGNAEYRKTVIHYGFRIDDEMRSKMSAETLAKLEALIAPPKEPI